MIVTRSDIMLSLVGREDTTSAGLLLSFLPSLAKRKRMPKEESSKDKDNCGW